MNLIRAELIYNGYLNIYKYYVHVLIIFNDNRFKYLRL